jgi:RimJ/RimL family protein N-acetyltransferase
MVNKEYRQNGFGTEIGTAALNLAFSGLSLHRVAVTCDARNTPACRLLKRIGMRQEGKFIQDQFLKGEWASTLYYALLKDEFLKRKTVSITPSAS